MKMKENLYRINYKNGNIFETKAIGMALKDGKFYQATKVYPYDNVEQMVLDGSKIQSVEILEKNNDYMDDFGR